MSPQCPDHPRALGATLGNCRECDREAATTDHAAGLATVRAAITRPTPIDPEKDQ